MRILVQPGGREDPQASVLHRRSIARNHGDRSVLDNGRIKVVVDPAAGGIISLVDLSTRREWVDPKPAIPFGQYRYDIFSRREIVEYLKSYAYDLEPWFIADFGRPGYPEVPHRTFTGRASEPRIERGPGWGAVITNFPQACESVEEMGNPAVVTQTITLHEESRWVDLEYRLTGKDESPLLEAGHVVFPFAARRPRYAVNKTGAVIDPSTDIARGANRLLHSCERWVDVEDGRAGILVIPFDSPLFSIGSMAIEQFDGDALPGDPVLYFNLFNTQWGTNFPQWVGGDLRYRFRFIPHTGDWRDARAWILAAAAVQPPVCLPVDSTALPAPSPQGILMAPLDDLETVVFKRAEQGEGFILRLRDPTGRGGRRTVRLRVPDGTPGGPAAVLCSLTEKELRPIPLTVLPGGVSLPLELRPFEIVTLKLKL
jgi:catechol 2,3-dioxygenase-like lactoylglutathione lyase family enzyme